MSFDKFKIILWKNWCVQKRNPKVAMFEILFPVILIVLMMWARSLFNFTEGSFANFATASLPLLMVFCMFFSVNNLVKVRTTIVIVLSTTYDLSRALQLNVKVN